MEYADDTNRQVTINQNPRYEHFTPAYDDGIIVEFGNFYFDSGFNLGELYYSQDGVLDAAYLCNQFFANKDGQISSPMVKLTPTFNRDGELESILPDVGYFEEENAEGYVAKGDGAYHLLEDAENPGAYVVTNIFDNLVFKIRTSVSGEWAIIEQEHVGSIPGNGVTKKIRFRATVP